MSEPVIYRYEDAVEVNFGKEYFTLREDGSVETQWREPTGGELMVPRDEEADVIYLLDQLQELNLSKAAWKKITEHFGGEW